MSRKRGLLFWLILAAFAATGIWWTLTIPRDVSRLYRAIPANASFVSVHSRTADRWKDLSGNPLILSLLSSVGVKQDALAKQLEDPNTLQWLKRLASDEVVVAYVPSLGHSGAPAWVWPLG